MGPETMAREYCADLSKRLRTYAGEKKSSWEVQKSTLGGRGLFATKPIKKGSLIFTNKPIVIGARGDAAAKIHCTKCYEISDSCVPCDKCQLILCSDICKLSQEHSTECHYITTYLKPKDKSEENSAVLARILIYFRFLLLSDEHKAVMKLLQGDCSLSSFQELDALCSRYFVSKEDKEKMIAINSILKTNSFRVASRSSEKKIPIRGLYPLSAFLNHSCLPNTRNVFNADNTMAVYATHDIEVGEEIVSCYTGLLWCTPARRCQLYKSKTFWCTCVRCSDPSEKGTKLSALKCLNTNCIGVLLPTDPLDGRTAWCCDICDTKVSSDRVNIVQSVLGSLVGTLQLDDKFNLESAVLERLASFVPYSNHIFVDIRLRLACKLGNNGGTSLNGIIKGHNISCKLSANKTNMRRITNMGSI